MDMCSPSIDYYVHLTPRIMKEVVSVAVKIMLKCSVVVLTMLAPAFCLQVKSSIDAGLFMS